jgi:hypothetical protein
METKNEISAIQGSGGKEKKQTCPREVSHAGTDRHHSGLHRQGGTVRLLFDALFQKQHFLHSVEGAGLHPVEVDTACDLLAV